VFFFFQAEDGIRDFHVTGVQTCALPILIAAVPIGLAGIGGLWSERAGVVNIGLEGMMILGTFGAGYFGYFYGPWQGVLGAILLRTEEHTSELQSRENLVCSLLLDKKK